jgi:uncharacterized protein YndB with AHSA1/START domain
VAAQLGVSRPTAGSASECGARIEREIQIDAPIERVWSLVSEPGWWIGDGDPSSRVATREGDLVVVTTHPHGRFPVLPISAGPPQYASYRGSEDPTQTPAQGRLRQAGRRARLGVTAHHDHAAAEQPFHETCHNGSWSRSLAEATLTHELSLPAAVPVAGHAGLTWISVGPFHVGAQLAQDGLVRERGQVACGVEVPVDLRYSRQAFDHGLSGCRNEERCP